MYLSEHQAPGKMYKMPGMPGGCVLRLSPQVTSMLEFLDNEARWYIIGRYDCLINQSV